MTDPIDRLACAMNKVVSETNFVRFIADRRADGWSDVDVSDYTESIRALMSDSASVVMSLFPSGTYQTAEIARQDACDYWAQQRN